MKGFTLAVVLEAGVGVAAICLGWLLGLHPAETLDIDMSGLATGLLATLPMLGGFLLLRRSGWEPLRRIEETLEEMIPLIVPDPSLPRLVLISAAAGFGEELLFRGLLQGGLVQQLGNGTGLILASIFFGLAHPLSRAYVAIAAVIGVYLGGLWMVTGNLFVPIVAHAAYDFVALVIITRPPRPQPPTR